jgi:coenzyme F420-reducing hydrogenase gamma subunit
MTTILLSIALAALAAVHARSFRVARAQQLQLADMAERIREMGARFEAAEADVAHAVTRADMAEVLLVEKGVADEEDIEAVRRRFIHGDDAPAPLEHEGELH